MTTVKGVIRNGQVVLEEPTNWPDGTAVTVASASRSDTPSTEDNQDLLTPEEIVQTLAAMEKVQPFDMTEEEEAEIEAWRFEVKKYTIANMHKGVGELFP